MFAAISQIFNNTLVQPLELVLLWLNGLVGDLGLAIILLTVGLRLLLYPLTLPSMKAAVKMRDLQPEIGKLKKKHKDDKLALQQAQAELFKQHQVNPAAGCLPQILQFIFLIALYRVFIVFFENGHQGISTVFLWFDLASSNNNLILALIAAASQFILGLMIMPAVSTTAEKVLAASTPTQKDDKEADSMSDMAVTMQKQMVFIMPVMTGIIALRFPAGLVLYWIVSTLFSLVQQYTVSGWGGLEPYLDKVKAGK
jgi:YidC/Oxa1 family membrane protein insertase